MRTATCPVTALLLAAMACACAPAPGSEQGAGDDSTARVYSSARHDFRVTTVADGLDHPWSMAWLPSGEMLIVERPGRLRVVRDGVLQADPVAGLPAVYRDEGQGGFMDVLPHPDFAQNRWLYLSYGKPNHDGSEGATAVVRGRWEGDRVTDVEEIFVADAWGDNNNHFAGRMAFGTDGYLYVAVGDRMVTPNALADHPALDLSNHMGTIVRLHDDGSVPSDNPFVGRGDALPEIWSYGHRNMQGLAVDPLTGDVWANEHGPRGGDELNLIVGGANYGWPVVSHGINYDGTVFTNETQRSGLESPRFVWTPSIGVSGMMIYRGDRFPWWRGNAFVGGLVGQQLARVTLAGQGEAQGEGQDEGRGAVSLETLLEGELGRIRDVREGPDGLIYLALEHIEELTAVVRLEPVPNDIEPLFNTFSIVAIDPATGESGVAVTTRNPCVGNAVPWVRAGVGAVATQGGTRVEYGNDLLDLLERGVAPQEAMDRVVAADDGRDRRQVGVIAADGRSAQWTGSGQYGAEEQGDWVAERTGLHYAVQGNSLVGTAVVDSVAVAFERSEGSGRHLADRLIEALQAGQRLGGDGRHGETQSAAVLVADPRPGMSRRPDGVTTDINVCEHPEPVRELRRIYGVASETLGFRRLEQFVGRDVFQLKVMLHALGYYRPESASPAIDTPGVLVYDQESVDAVDRFRADQNWQTTVPGYVDSRTIDRLWSLLEEAGRADEVRDRIRDVVRVRR